MKRRNGKTITAVWSQGPQPRPLLSQTPAARSPTFPRVPGPPLANPSSFPPSLLPHLALSGLKLQGMSLSSTAATTGKSQAPHPCHFCSELLTPVYPQLTLLILFIFPWQQWPRKSHPTPICPSTKKKKKSHKTYVALNQQEGQPRACGEPRCVPYPFLPSVSIPRKKQLKKSLSLHIPCPQGKPFPRANSLTSFQPLDCNWR